MINCSIYKPTGNGINMTGTFAYGGNPFIANTYIDTANQSGKYAITNSSGTNSANLVCVANAYYACTGNVNGLGDAPLIFDSGTLASSAFNAPSSQNFNLNSVGYRLGSPGQFEKLPNTTGYIDIGAAQHQGGGMGQIMRTIGQCFPVW